MVWRRKEQKQNSWPGWRNTFRSKRVKERGRSVQLQNCQFICLLLSEEEEELLEEVEEEEEEELIEGEGEEVDVEGEVAEDSATKEEVTVQATTSQPPPPDTNKGYGCLYHCMCEPCMYTIL